ncbi:MAG TPA: Uma2 family endonuclease [Symbiobacteriaceae bacterium]|nr:Uma2 family endonuclease [Symbiobacteriaceae bacterium]
MSLPGHYFTYEDYKLMPEEKRCEIIEGELLITPSPTHRHQSLQMRLSHELYSFVMKHGLGDVVTAPMDVILSPENVIQPDVLFVANERLSIINSNGGIHGAPDLAVEILSPSTAPRDQVLKRKLYARFGVREYWIVDSESQTVEVMTLAGSTFDTWQRFTADQSLASPLLPGFAIKLGDIFKL